MMVAGYGLVDEYLMACILLGALLRLSLRPVGPAPPPARQGSLGKLHRQVFFLFVFYMTYQSLRGMIMLGDLRVARFVIFFAAIGVLAYIIGKGYFYLPPPHRLARHLLLGTSVYFVLYMGQGLVAEFFRGMGRYDTQGIEWSGSTIGMFPLYIAMPPALFLLKGRGSRLGFITVALSVAAAFYYDSRFSLLAVTAFMVLSLRILNIRRVAVLAAVVLAAMVFLAAGIEGEGIGEKIDNLGKALYSSASAFTGSPRESDMDRKLHVIAAVRTVADNPLRAVFGTGFYTHRYEMVPYLAEAIESYGLSIVVSDITRPASFSAFLVDTGLVGLILLGMNFLLTAHALIIGTKDKGYRNLLLLSLALVVLSMFISLNYDLVLFYLAFMPAGLLIQAGGCEAGRPKGLKI